MNVTLELGVCLVLIALCLKTVFTTDHPFLRFWAALASITLIFITRNILEVAP